MHRGELTDRQWQRLVPLLPPEKPHVGRPNAPHRRVVEGIRWLLRTGAPWRDLPERYGSWKTVSSRFYRWERSGVWSRVLTALQEAEGAAGRVDFEVHHVGIRCADPVFVREGGSGTRRPWQTRGRGRSG